MLSTHISRFPVRLARATALAVWIAAAFSCIASTPELEEARETPPLPPSQFDPDPGGIQPSVVEPLPLFPSEAIPLPDYGTTPPPPALQLPRHRLSDIIPFLKKYDYRKYDPAETRRGMPPHSEPVPNRWKIDFGTWKRYMDPSTETPYMYKTPALFHPYRQSVLKGDSPIIGQDIFANITLKNFSLFEFRKLPTPSGVSAAQPNSSEFFGRSRQILFSNDTSVTLDLFKGETVFKPLDWALHFMTVYNANIFSVEENNNIDADPRGTGYPYPQNSGSILGGNTATLPPGSPVGVLGPGLSRAPSDLSGTRYTTRTRDFFALQEAYAEVHLRDLSPTYDFVSARFGIQPFTSDFRGFIFSDSNLGIRLFGNLDSNRYQYNFAFFDMREKDTYSDLNTFEPRDQYVFIANLYKQDFFAKGYTAQWSLHWNIDQGREYLDRNGFVTRPALLGTPKEHDVQAVYLGWTGDGHIGRLNITHAFYEVLGQDQFNGLAGRRVDINAQMAAAEVSLDKDWIRYKLSFFYASGDSNPNNSTATGFDSIQDNPAFIGGPFSWYAHQGFNLAGTAVNLKQRDSLVPDLRSSKSEGQSNFVNPGAFILGAGVDFDLTPKLRQFVNINHIWLASTAPVAQALQTNHADNALGWDLSTGYQYRPLLTENVVLSAGVGLFLPGQGYKDIYRTNTNPVPGFGPQGSAGHVDSILYNVFFTVTLTF